MCLLSVVGSFDCDRTIVLRVIVYAFAVVYCKVAFHSARVCRLYVCVFLRSCFRFVHLRLYACFVYDCVCVFHCMCNIAFHITCV